MKIVTRYMVMLAFAMQAASHWAYAGDNQIAPELARLGQQLYAENCAICHGPAGVGDGALASEFLPRPRNFTNGNFKFTSSVSGDPPTRADLIKVIERGIEGSYGRSMPAFENFTSTEKIALAEVIRQFAQFESFGTPLELTPKPAYADYDRAGSLYASLGCAACHGKTGNGDGDLAAELTDEDGNPIKPAIFTSGMLKGGTSAEEIWFRIYGGVSGTPMPSFGRNISAEDIWQISLLIEAVINK